MENKEIMRKYIEKTEIQRKIEFAVTKGRTYQTVPHVRFFGDRLALKQWLKYSNFRCFFPHVTSSDSTSFLTYYAYLGYDVQRRIFEEDVRRGIELFLIVNGFNNAGRKRLETIRP